MCGIAGAFAYTPSAEPLSIQELLAVRDAMRPRGPDGAGMWMHEDRRVGLAHRRLAIIDLSQAAAQPMASHDGRLRIVYNGEIYNYRELRQLLSQQGHVFRTTSDTEVLLTLYDEYGLGMFDHLRGMYAFALWDDTRATLHLARDPLGIKPLYYADDGHTLRFASQVKALLASQHVGREPDAAGHVGFFLWGSVPDPYTLYRQIRAVPAGTVISLSRARGKTERCFCSVKELILETERDDVAPGKAVAESLLQALHDTVKHHLVADVPVGLFLSSGLDSTMIASLASSLVTEPLRTVTLGFAEYRGTPRDETPLAEEVARRIGSHHQTVWIQLEEFRRRLPEILAAMDQPSIDGVNTYCVSKIAAETGLKVAMSGLGGDEIFGGYATFRELPRLVRLGRFWSWAPGLGRVMRKCLSPWVGRWTSPKYASLFEYAGSYADAYLLRRGLFMPWELPRFLDAELVREGLTELRPLDRLEQLVRGIRSPRLKVSVLELCNYMRHQLLRDADWAGMAHSLEIRVPFVDRVFLQAILRLIRLKPDVGKRDAAKVLLRPLPDAVLHRPKTGFSIPVDQWTSQQRMPPELQRGLRAWAFRVYEAALSDGSLGTGELARRRLSSHAGPS